MWCLWISLLGVYQNIVVEANVYCINLNPGKVISNRILFPGDVMDGAVVFGYCREMTLPGRPSILDPREGMHKVVVVSFDD